MVLDLHFILHLQFVTIMKAKPITAAILIYLIVALALVISGNAQASASATSEGGSCSSNDVDKNDDSCLANDQTSEPQQQQQQQPPKEPQPVSVTFLNNSPYRADIHYNDGRFGNIVGTANESGGQVQVSTFIGHRFFITMNGVRNSLVDPSTDEQYFFTVGTLPQEQFFVVPKEAAPSETQCKDRYPVCVHEAARGECNVNPGWMIVNCCKSCDDAEGYGNLIDSTIRCDPKRLNSTIPAWKSGSLDTLFDKWATLEEYKQYDPHVISSPNKEMYGGSHEGPWIMTFDNFLDDLEIRSLLKGAQITGFERSTDQGKIVNNQEMVKVTSTSRTSLNAWCRGECEKLPGVKRVTDRIEEVTGIPQNNYESFQILQYDEGQFYRKHHDSSQQNAKKPAGHRILTFFLYLNDVEEGGETRFTNLDISVKPKKGRALIWPSVQNDDVDKTDLRMYHEAKDVIKGTKYAANHWIHQYDFRNANHWGCNGSFG